MTEKTNKGDGAPSGSVEAEPLIGEPVMMGQNPHSGSFVDQDGVAKGY